MQEFFQYRAVENAKGNELLSELVMRLAGTFYKILNWRGEIRLSPAAVSTLQEATLDVARQISDYWSNTGRSDLPDSIEWHGETLPTAVFERKLVGNGYFRFHCKSLLKAAREVAESCELLERPIPALEIIDPERRHKCHPLETLELASVPLNLAAALAFINSDELARPPISDKLEAVAGLALVTLSLSTFVKNFVDMHGEDKTARKVGNIISPLVHRRNSDIAAELCSLLDTRPEIDRISLEIGKAHVPGIVGELTERGCTVLL